MSLDKYRTYYDADNVVSPNHGRIRHIRRTVLLDPSVWRCRQGFLQFAQCDGFIFIKPPSRLRACETTDFVRDGLEPRTEGFARIHALGDQLLIATTKTCI